MLLKLIIISFLTGCVGSVFRYNDLPVDKEDGRLLVDVLMTLEKISSFNPKELDFSMIYFQEQFWKVKRNQCDHHYLNNLEDYLNLNLTAGKQEIKKYNINLFHISGINLWLPNTFQIDSKSISALPAQNEFIELELKEDHCHFNLRTRLKVKVGCPMSFKNYPNDYQVCPFRLTSYTHPLRDVEYRWKGLITDQLVNQISQYTLSLTKTQYNATRYGNEKFSFLSISFRFENHLSHYLMQVIIPTYFIISIVYLNSYLYPDGSPGRFLLTILTFISLVTIYTANREKLPAVHYATAVDIWMLGNLFFVFLAVSELVLHCFLMKKLKKINKQKKKAEKNQNKNIFIINANDRRKARMSDGELNFGFGSNEHLQTAGTVNHQISHRNRNANSSGEILRIDLNLNEKEPVVNNVRKRNFRNSIGNILNGPKNLHKIYSINLDRLFRIYYPLAYLIFNFLYWIFLLNRWFDSI